MADENTFMLPWDSNNTYGYDPGENRKSLKDVFSQGNIEKGIAAVNGLTSVLGMTAPMSQIADTSMQQNQIRDYNNLSGQNFANYGQLYNMQNYLYSLQPDLSWDTIRGGSTMERVGSTISSIGSAAATGAQIAGPWGALGGAVIGGALAAGNWITGNHKADVMQSGLRLDNQIAAENGKMNFDYGNESVADDEHRSKIATQRADGGQIKRSQSMREFADSVLGNQKSNSVSHSAGIQRKKVDGGVSVRIKRK